MKMEIESVVKPHRMSSLSIIDIQSGVESLDAVSSWVIFSKRALELVALLLKMTHEDTASNTKVNVLGWDCRVPK